MNGLTLHGARPVATEPYRRSVLEFSSEWIGPMLDELQLSALLLPFYKLNHFLFRGLSTADLEEMDELLRQIAMIRHEGKGVHVTDEAASFNLRLQEGELFSFILRMLMKLYQISRSRLQQLPPQESEKSRYVDEIVIYIQSAFQQRLSLDDIAERLNLSKYHMCRVFKEMTGLTVMQYLTHVRLQRAKYLLEVDNEKTISDIALETGFDTASHFSRIFRKQVHQPPSKYRKEKKHQRHPDTMQP